MGCDIHLFVEKRSNPESSWQSADVWEPDQYRPERIRVPYNKEFYNGRSYSLFAILANVRNGSGTAGVDTGDGFQPIDMPRGLPHDVCEIVQSESDKWDVDGHSHSWFTVDELLKYDWCQVAVRRGVVRAYEFARWNAPEYGGRAKNRSPDEWCSWTSGETIGSKEMEDKINALPGSTYWEKVEQVKTTFPNLNCAIQWSEPYYSCCSDFWSDTMPRLLNLGDPTNVRIVFWFDN